MGLKNDVSPVVKTKAAKADKGDVGDLVCPKGKSPHEQLKKIVGESISLNSSKEFDAYINRSVDRQGKNYENAIARRVKEIVQEIQPGRVREKEAVELQRRQVEQQLETMIRRREKRDEEEEEQLRERNHADDVQREIREDLASGRESDGGEIEEDKEEP